MTWLKTGDEFPLDCAAAELSDAAYRTHHEGLTWVLHRERGPFVPEREVRRFAESPDYEAAVKELVAAGFWQETPGGYVLVHGMEAQPTPEEIAQRRAQTAERNRAYRARKRQQRGGDAS